MSYTMILFPNFQGENQTKLSLTTLQLRPWHIYKESDSKELTQLP